MSRKHNISFIISIHQPNVEVLDMFDNLYVLSKGGVNVYSGPPLLLRHHMNYCHIDCTDNEIPIEKLLKICANDSNHTSIVDMREKTQNIVNNLNEQVVKDLILNRDRKLDRRVKLSLRSTWCLAQRMLMVYFKTLSLVLLLVISMYSLIGYTLNSYYDFTISKYRDCQPNNSTQICYDFIDMIKQFKNVRYELKFIFGVTTSPFTLTSLWTSLVLSKEINVFLWEYKNG